MRYYHYGYKSGSRSEDGENNSGECFMAETGSIKKRTVYNSSLVIEDDTVYEIDEECIRCRK